MSLWPLFVILFHCEGEATPTRSLRPLPGLWLAARRLAGGELEGLSAVDFRGAKPFVPSGPLGCRTTCLEMETYKQTNHWTRIQIRLAAQNHITVVSPSPPLEEEDSRDGEGGTV